MRRLAITIDIDSPTEYAALHGVDLRAEDPHLMYRGPLQRFAGLCREVGGPATLFAIARDVSGVATTALLELMNNGFEIGCHSYQHDYAMAQRTRQEIAHDVGRASYILSRELGVKPRGFRAPGYGVNADMLDELESQGFSYDSSVLPSPPYYAAKLAALCWYRLRGRKSVAVLGDANHTLAPREPFRPGRRPTERGERPIIELPVAVTPALRLPLTGAALCLAPKPLQRRLLRELPDTVVIVLHAMDLVDPATDAVPSALARFEPQLRVPLATRLARLRFGLQRLASDRSVTTCLAIAEEMHHSLPMASVNLSAARS